jgi:ATP-binding cassette subfamily B multidrug efflux pump
VVAVATSLTLRLNAMSGWIMWAISNFFRELGVVSEGMQTIAQPVTLLDRTCNELQVTGGVVTIRDLSHHYGREKGGLDRINLQIAPGEKVGLVGQSGAGKSTLVKLLLRFYDIEQGSIAIDGHDIANVTQDSLRRAIGMVQQDSSLLHRSVRENIQYGNPDAAEDQMIAAANRPRRMISSLGWRTARGTVAMPRALANVV